MLMVQVEKPGTRRAIGCPMFQFYVSAKDDARRCKMSFDEQVPITVTGTTDGDNARTFIGVV
jgi:hypothetical protein